jgi:hypothetical protein
MLRIGRIVVSCAVLALGAEAHASSFSISGAGGIALPVGSTNDLLQNGPTAEVRAALVPSSSVVGIRLDGLYARQKDEQNLGAAEPAPHTTFAGATANAVVWFWRALPVTPYVFGGAGLVRSTPGDSATAFPRATSDLALNGGGGFAHRYGSWGWFVEGRVLHVRSEDDAGTVEAPDDTPPTTNVHVVGGLTWWLQ